tara:strand:- start:4304 stop:6856 length:2553 start_codon:yes stop_codon:yes gene_type:complete
MSRFVSKLVYTTFFIFLLAVLATLFGVLPTPILFAQSTNTLTECTDGIDNDGNGFIDYPDDPGCVSLEDNEEFDVSSFSSSGAVEFTFITPIEGSILTGLEELSATVFGIEPINVEFEIESESVYRLSTTLNDIFWEGVWSTEGEINQSYSITIVAYDDSDGSPYRSDPISVEVSNPITESLAVTIKEPVNEATVSGITIFNAETNIPVDSLSFVLVSGIGNIPLGSASQLADESWEILYDTNSVSDGSYNLLAEAIINDPPDFASSQINFNIQNVITTLVTACADYIDNDGDGLIDLNDPGCDNSEDNNEFNEPTEAPPPPPEPETTTQCSDGFDNDGDGYTDLVDFDCDSPEDDTEFNESTTEPEPEPEPEPDRVNPEIAEECAIAGIVDFDACNRFLFEISNQLIDDSPENLLPQQCIEANITNQEQCDQFLKNTFLPDECRQANISSVDDCDIYLAGLYLSPECLSANILDQSVCDEYLNEQYLDVECSLADKTDVDACQDHILETYATDVTCNGLDDQTCSRALRERHLNDLIIIQQQNQIIEEIILENNNQTVTLQKVTEEVAEDSIENFVPIVIEDDTNITLLPSVSQVLLNERDEIVQTPSAVIIFDSDSDGVSDEIERRLGTNPFLADTDSDGFIDGDELRKNLNPSGGGDLLINLTPAEQALVNKAIIEQPKVAGAISRQLIVTNVEDVKLAAEGITVQKFSGLAFPDSVVTLYIYSDLPLVVTVNVDKFGNWEYTLQRSLVDGKHEIYLTVNDNTGKIIAKSNPLSFLIEEAKAVSPEEFIAAQRSARSSAQSKQIFIYIILAFIFTIAGIVLFVYFLKFRKSSPSNETTGGIIDGGVE